MVQVTKTDEIKMNDETLRVEELPEHVQGLVRLYDGWRQQAEDAREDLLQKEMAIGALQDRIAAELNNLKAAANEEVTAPETETSAETETE